MSGLSERVVSRRTLLKTAVPLLLTASTSCSSEEANTQTVESVERDNNLPQWGDILNIGGKPFLLKNNKRYALLNTPEDFLRNTKGRGHHKRILDQTRSVYSQLPIGDMGTRFVIDPYTGEGKVHYQKGGDMDKFYAGFVTDSGAVSNVLSPDSETFVRLQEALEQNGRARSQRLYETYGVRAQSGKFEGYRVSDTLFSPDVIVKKAIDALTEQAELFPGASLNLAGQSLGAYIAFWTAVAHPDKVNNLALFSGPIRGIKKSYLHEYATPILKDLLLAQFGISEKVSDYFYDLAKDKSYQKKVDEGVLTLQKAGVVIRSYTNQRDLIVPPESSMLRGVTRTIGKEYSAFELLRMMSLVIARDAVMLQAIGVAILEEHGRTVNDPDNIKEVVAMFGKQLGEV